jgi:hypothetical protein
MTPLSARERRWSARMATVVFASAGLFVFACSEADPRILGYGIPDGGSAPVFVEPPDAGDTDAGDELISYCPSSHCPAGWTTCPGSRFACEVNLRTDARNCGACGRACPEDVIGANEIYTCVDGQCVMACDLTMSSYDCDGVPDNGCEVLPNNESCTGCDEGCPDPARPCLMDNTASWRCGCPDNGIYCGFLCRDGKTDDYNCGTCGNVCDRTGGRDPANIHPTTYYGCYDGECGKLKCEALLENCDYDMGNGCETSLISDDNCGVCGNVCAAGTKCVLDAESRVPVCACPKGQSFCGDCIEGSFCIGKCVDFSADIRNCGGCGIACVSPANSLETCSYGSCGFLCDRRFADCNGNFDDGCETDIDRDPRNCGGCGVTCDESAGQACVLGQCVVEPCDVVNDGGAGPR